MPRTKKQAIHVPADLTEATQMIAEFVELERKEAIERLSAEVAIDKTKKQLGESLAEIAAEKQPLFAGIKAWWEAGGQSEVARGKKSAEIANAKLGHRLGMPAVKFARKVKAADVIAWLQGLRWGRAKDFLTVKITLDKQAIIKAVRAEPEIAQTFKERLTVEQAEEFFIDTGLDEDAIRKELAA